MQCLQGARSKAGGAACLGGVTSAALLCLGRLIRGAPPAVVRAQLEQLLPAVLEALGGDARVDDAEVATALLLTLSEALMDPTGAHPPACAVCSADMHMRLYLQQLPVMWMHPPLAIALHLQCIAPPVLRSMTVPCSA